MVKNLLKVKNQNKVGKTATILGFNAARLKSHIELHPNWKEIRKNKWHIDHIFPVKAFLDHGIRDIATICQLNNLQPLIAKDNLTKHDKYDINEFRNWLESKGINYVV